MAEGNAPKRALFSPTGTPKKMKPDTRSVDCFLHNVTAPTKSKSGTVDYFVFHAQTETEYVRCFSYAISKHQQINKLATDKTPVEINFVVRQTSDSFNFRLDNWTKINILDNLSFPYISQNSIFSLNNLQTAKANDLFTISVKILSSSEQKSTSKGLVTEFVIGDDTAIAHLDAWGEFAKLIKIDQCYTFENIAVTRWNDECKLSTRTFTTMKEIESEIAVHTENTLFEVETEDIILGSIGLVSLDFSIQCMNCFTLLKQVQERTLVCPSCHKMQRTQFMVKKFKGKATIFTPTKERKNIIFTDQALISFLEKLIDITDLSEETAEALLLDCNELLFTVSRTLICREIKI